MLLSCGQLWVLYPYRRHALTWYRLLAAQNSHAMLQGRMVHSTCLAELLHTTARIAKGLRA